jgi:hypothetical protein
MQGGNAAVDCWFILTSAVNEQNRRRKVYEALRMRRERLEQVRAGDADTSADSTAAEVAARDAEDAARDGAARMGIVVAGIAVQLQLQTGFDRDDFIQMIAESAFPPKRRVEIRQSVIGLDRSGWNAELLAFVWNEYPREAEELGLPKSVAPEAGPRGGPMSRGGADGGLAGGSRAGNGSARSRAMDEGSGGDDKPKAYLQGWAEILAALGKKNNDSEKSLVNGWNQKYEGPIQIAGAGSRPKVERTRLIAWWNRLEIQFETENRARDAAASVEETHRYGRDGVVAPDIAGSVRKRRQPRPRES